MPNEFPFRWHSDLVTLASADPWMAEVVAIHRKSVLRAAFAYRELSASRHSDWYVTGRDPWPKVRRAVLQGRYDKAARLMGGWPRTWKLEDMFLQFREDKRRRLEMLRL